MVCALIISLRSTRINKMNQIPFLKTCECLGDGLTTVPLFLRCSIGYVLGNPIRKQYCIISKYSKQALPSLIDVQIN